MHLLPHLTPSLLLPLLLVILPTALAAPSPFPIAEPLPLPQLMTDSRPPPAPPAGASVATTCANEKFCGRVYFKDQAVEFNQAMCMEIRGDWKSVWVANCQCTFWTTCSPGKTIWNSAPRDIFLKSMRKCEPERTVASFGVKPKFMSCSYQNAL